MNPYLTLDIKIKEEIYSLIINHVYSLSVALAHIASSQVKLIPNFVPTTDHHTFAIQRVLPERVRMLE